MKTTIVYEVRDFRIYIPLYIEGIQQADAQIDFFEQDGSYEVDEGIIYFKDTDTCVISSDITSVCYGETISLTEEAVTDFEDDIRDLEAEIKNLANKASYIYRELGLTLYRLS